MSMNKKVNIPLETTANYQPLSDLNVRFWNQDKNTAELRFIITRNQYPLSLSKENVKVIIALESGANFISSDDLIIDSEVEGVARYIIPNDFMRVASNVTGQVYVTTLDGEEVIVERQFKFTVSNDLLNDYPSEDKLRYIKTFDDLRTEISSRVSKLEYDMETMEDYVTQVQDTTQSGIKELNNLIKSNEEKLQSDYNDKINTINNKGQEYSDKFDEYKSDIDKKKSDFEKSVNGSGLVTTGESKSWQKYKLTEENSQRIRISDIDPVELNSGFYQMWRMKNAPVGSDDNTQYWNVDITSARDGVKQIVATISSNGKTYKKNVHRDVDSGWKEVAFIDVNNPYETTKGSQNKATTAENNARQYTDEKFAKRHNILFEGNANGVGTPINLSEALDNFIILYIYGDFPGGEFVSLGNPQGTRNININTDNVVGFDGSDATSYECSLTKVNNQKLEINSDNFVNIPSGDGSGANADRFTIQKIVGVYK